jgi:hypothetical protein
MTSCYLVECYQYFGRKFCFHCQGALGPDACTFLFKWSTQASRHLHRVCYVSWRHKGDSVTNKRTPRIAWFPWHKIRIHNFLSTMSFTMLLIFILFCPFLDNDIVFSNNLEVPRSRIDPEASWRIHRWLSSVSERKCPRQCLKLISQREISHPILFFNHE